MSFFPFFVDLEGQAGLIVGGGKIALHKIKKLLPYGPKLTVVAPRMLPELEELALKNDIYAIKLVKRSFEDRDITDMKFVIAASDDTTVNDTVSRLCKEQNILVNVVDRKEACSFIFPSLVKAGHLSVGISTEGASPEVAASIRGQLASGIPANMDEILAYLGSLRPIAKRYIADDGKRSAFLKDMARSCMDSNTIFDEAETTKRLKEYADTERTKIPGTVLLVGAGCGAYDLITLKGLRAIRRAQVLVYDDLIDSRLLDYAPESCELIYVGKRSGRHSMKQDEINALLVRKAKEGGLVVRLKGGDPFVFGRGKEEILALEKEGIKASYIPGVTSCIAVPAEAGIPVTHRELSRSFHVITGHTATGSGELAENIDFEALSRVEGTLIFLMGFGHLLQISQELIIAGKSPDTPVAVVHGNFDGTTDVVRGTLADIVQKVSEAGIATPAVIVVGEVAELS